MKKIIIALLLILSGSYPAISQTFEMSPNQQFIEDAIKDGILIVNQEYQLQDTETKQLYGRNNKEFFGKTYSMLLKVEDGYYGDIKIVKPWLYDSNYMEYRDKNKYTPKISGTSYRNIDNHFFKPSPFDADSYLPITEDFLYMWPGSDGDIGMQKDTTTGHKEGWLIWVTAEEELHKSDSAHLQLEIYRTDIDIKKESCFYEIKNSNTNRIIIGGFYVFPLFTKIGQVTFSLVGILQQIDNKWNIVTIGVHDTYIHDEKSESLTPVSINGNKRSTN